MKDKDTLTECAFVFDPDNEDAVLHLPVRIGPDLYMTGMIVPRDQIESMYVYEFNRQREVQVVAAKDEQHKNAEKALSTVDSSAINQPAHPIDNGSEKPCLLVFRPTDQTH